jgi:hypothetical protein
MQRFAPAIDQAVASFERSGALAPDRASIRKTWRTPAQDGRNEAARDPFAEPCLSIKRHASRSNTHSCAMKPNNR